MQFWDLEAHDRQGSLSGEVTRAWDTEQKNHRRPLRPGPRREAAREGRSDPF